jgi:Glycine/serine hydroxymethyltransferase
MSQYEDRIINQKPISEYTIEDLESIADRHEKWFDESCIVLYAASNHLNPVQRRILGSTAATRVAEGEVNKKFYQMGTQFVNEMERVAVEGMKKLFHAEWADCRIQSGTLANIAVELAITKPGDTIMSITLSAGSHTSHTSLGFPVTYGLNVVDIPFDNENINVDLEKFEETLKNMAVKPKLLILGGSLFVFRFPVKEVRALLDKYSPDTVLLFDAAHVDGLIAGGAYPNPLDDGADLISGSTYKSLGGPAGGFVVGKSQELHKKVRRAIYPGVTTSYHSGRLGALAATCISLLKVADTYAPQVVRNAKAFGAALDAKGFTVIGKNHGYTDTHQILISMPEGDFRSAEAGRLLEDAYIITSPQLLPWEPREAVRNPLGIRLGTQEVTRNGMKEKDMETIAAFMAEIIYEKKDPRTVAVKVELFRKSFTNPMY